MGETRFVNFSTVYGETLAGGKDLGTVVSYAYEAPFAFNGSIERATMFMGHYGVSFAAKPAHRRLPLWLLFVAVQWLDIWWAVLVLLGALSAPFFKPRGRTFLVVAVAAFSHWLLDLVVHIPDLPLIGNHYKVGFGLWRHLWLSFPLELVVLWGGALLYARYVKATSVWGAIWLWVFVAALTFEEINVSFGLVGPFFAEPAAIAALSLGIYLLVALLAGLVGLTRKTET